MKQKFFSVYKLKVIENRDGYQSSSLGTWINSFPTKDEAEQYILSLDDRWKGNFTIIEVWA